jgi:hypothetical protein
MPVKSDFKNSGDIEAAARVLLGLARKPGSDDLRIGVLKQTNGAAGDQVGAEVRFVGLAGMIEDCEGTQVVPQNQEVDA